MNGEFEERALRRIQKCTPKSVMQERGKTKEEIIKREDKPSNILQKRRRIEPEDFPKRIQSSLDLIHDDDSTIFGLNPKAENSYCSVKSQFDDPVQIKTEHVRCESEDRSLLSSVSNIRRDLT